MTRYGEPDQVVGTSVISTRHLNGLTFLVIYQMHDGWHQTEWHPVYGTYMSVMFSMSLSGSRMGKSSMPGSWSIQKILEVLQEQDAGQEALSFSSPIKTP